VAIKALSPQTRIHTVEPEEFDDTARSLRDGVRRTNASSARSICDALLAPSPGELPFAIHRHLGTTGLTVSDAEVRDAIRFAFLHLKIVVEPGGAVSLAAVLANRIDCRNKTTAIVLTGGNIDPQLFSEIQSEA
jgi:threonine dehydratase